MSCSGQRTVLEHYFGVGWGNKKIMMISTSIVYNVQGHLMNLLQSLESRFMTLATGSCHKPTITQYQSCYKAQNALYIPLINCIGIFILNIRAQPSLIHSS